MLVMCILCVVVLLWRSFFTGIFWWASAPLLQTGKVVLAPIDFILGGFSSKATLARENANLQAELASSTALVSDRDALYLENLDLKARFLRDARPGIILGGVLTGPPGVPYDTLLIDAGAAQGVAVGDVVSAGGTTLIGTIGEVHHTTASVLLYSSPGQRYSVLLVPHGTASTTPTKSVPIELEGQGGASLRGEVPAGTLVRVGDMVVTPGVAGGFVGSVSVVTKKDSESFETLYVTLPINPLELRFVEVWKKE